MFGDYQRHLAAVLGPRVGREQHKTHKAERRAQAAEERVEELEAEVEELRRTVHTGGTKL